MSQPDREGRDAAGIGPYARERENLVSLSSLGAWDVSEGDPDIRGWEVRTVSGRQLGAVADLLVDAKAGEVVLLDIDLPGSDRHTFVPIRVVEIDRTRRVVLMDSADLPESGAAISDREVVVARSSTAADVPLVRPRLADAVDIDAVERRRAERRRIDRVSTDL